MFNWPWSKKDAKPVTPPPPPHHSPPPSPVASRIERLPPLPTTDDEVPTSKPALPPVQHHPTGELDSLRASIEASITQRKERAMFEQLALDQPASSPFYSVDNQQFRTLREFANAVLVMDDRVFSYHVNERKNDFVNWIEACFDENAKQAAQLLRGKSRQEMAVLFNHVLQPHKHEPFDSLHTDFAPLPPSPLEQTSDQRIHNIVDAIQTVEHQLSVDRVGARDSFIQLRTRIWQELNDSERKQVLPQLRAVYEKLR